MQTDVRRTCVMNVIYKACASHTSSILFGEICKHVVGWLPVPLVLQVTRTVATTINMTGII